MPNGTGFAEASLRIPPGRMSRNSAPKTPYDYQINPTTIVVRYPC